MDINYEVPVAPGQSVKFTGSLSAEETEFLLQFALVTLLQRGMLVSTIDAQQVKQQFEPVERKDMN